ncbi:MAG: EAL domain-containing protein [Chloroflexota bacterium]|nr:MAG: EAL domain-containing protein [Chloroflexota bacterium]
MRVRAKWESRTSRRETSARPDRNARAIGLHVAPAAGLRPAIKVWTLTASLAIVATAIWLGALWDRPAPPGAWIPWPVFAIAFALAELKVVDVHFRRETHSFSLSEFPAVIGFFVLSPSEYLLAVLVGASLALIVQRRQRLIKTTFNLANMMCVAAVSLLIVRSLAAVDGVPGPHEWAVAFLATFVATVIGAISIALVITLSGGAPQFEKLPEMIRFGSMVAFANTSLALLAVVIIQTNAVLLWLMALPLGIVFVAYRAYLSEREKHERLELLYQSSRILQHSPELDSSLVAILDHARAMFRAELAEVVLHPRAEDLEALRTSSWHEADPQTMVPMKDFALDPMYAGVIEASGPFFFEPAAHPRVRHGMVAPLKGESELIGSLMIGNRLTEGTSYSDDDLRLLETLSNQIAVALENGHLERSLAELSRLKEELNFQAYHDSLTGLANRSLFVERVTEHLAGHADQRMPVVLFLDLDDFKTVNDTLGHAAGDRLLVEVADRLRSVLRPDDLPARLGGDEFAVLLLDEPDLQVAVAVADRIIDALRVTFLLGTSEVQVGGSIGIAAARLGTERADELLRNADVAMYTAKTSGKNRVAIFEPTMHAAIVARHELSLELSKSLGRGELVLQYQPIIDLRTSTAVGVEALVRWRHPTRGLLGPDDFIPLAEETGSIVALGTWVLDEACRQAAAWSASDAIGRPITITINLAAQQLQEQDFVDTLMALLDDSGLRPEQLVLEMTETVIFHDTSATIARLEEIRALGVRIAIDDFGTGYSSLGYLRRFRVDILKVAKEFIGETDNPDEWPFAAAIVALGRALGMTIIAEGIEEHAQLAHLRGLGCELGQGYLFARPLDGDAAGRYLEEFAPAVRGASARPAARPTRSDRAEKEPRRLARIEQASA